MNKEIRQEPIDLSALKRLDKLAFAELIDAYGDQIYRLGLKMLGNEQDAEDILQETFIKAYKNIQKFEGRSKVSTWLYRIAVNEALMLIRKQKDIFIEIDEEIETSDGNIIPKQIVDWCCLPEEELMSLETRQAIDEAITTLTPTNRAAFLLRDVEGLSTQEAAEALGISQSALKVRLMRARMALREELSSFFSERVPSEPK